MDFLESKLLRLGPDENTKNILQEDLISLNKEKSRIETKARQLAKLEYCYYCNKNVAGLCNSHSIPRFCLKRISKSGKVYYANTLIELPYMNDDKGVNEAGTFHLICQDCDNKIFQDYENPALYREKPTGNMLAQIAMKNYLLLISKRLYERSFYTLLGEEFPRARSYTQHMLDIISVDLVDYENSFKRAKKGSSGNHKDWYYLCYYQKLDYTVPIAFQGGIMLVCDFRDKVINDIYNFDPKNHINDIHIAVFPLEDYSVVMMFIDSRDSRYRKFYKELRKLPLEDQLSTINYIIFSYSEEIYLSKDIPAGVMRDENLIDISRKTNITVSDTPYGNSLETAIKEYSLSKRAEVPNLLLRQYRL